MTTLTDIKQWIEDYEPESLDELYDLVDQQTEIIYYSNAIAYLKENDPSLTESLELAAEFGYTAEKLNSEFLASLHNAEKARELISQYEYEIEELLNN